MPQTDCWLTDETVLRELSSFFSDVDQEFSRFYEEQYDTSETALDGALGTYLRSSKLLRLPLSRINHARSRTGRSSLHIDFRHITRTERTHGADIGLLLHLAVPNEQVLQKAVLVQSKRLYPDRNQEFTEHCHYPEIFGDRVPGESVEGKLEPQWKRMLNISPSSVYLLYGSEKFSYRNNFPNLGTRVIPAQRIAGIFASSTNRRGFTAYDAYQMAKPFSQWMVENFICCSVGDTNELVINTALGRNADFPVKSSLEVLISTDRNQLELDLWSQ
jgi:hypothetical protein